MLNSKIKILHVTPHLGGGIGKAVAGIVVEAQQSDAGYEHEVLCLCTPEKNQFIDQIRKAGCTLEFGSTAQIISEKITKHDIVQLEFWNHPATLAALCTYPLPPMRLLVWCHVSGTHFPIIPTKFLLNANKLLFTSPCSYTTEEVRKAILEGPVNLDVVSSGGGLDLLPQPQPRDASLPLRFGYVGSLNFAKLHPDFIACLSKVSDPSFKVRLVGDKTNREILEQQCRENNRANLLEFGGYTNDIAAELDKLDVMIYLLNPKHYGTAENALIEGMAMGVVPIILNNEAESKIVKNRVTGLCLDNMSELDSAIQWISANRDKHLDMAVRCQKLTREKYSYKNSLKFLHTFYDDLKNAPQKVCDFKSIFGKHPSDWFLSFIRDKSIFLNDGSVHLPANQNNFYFFEKTKGSVSHFFDFFPDDDLLRDWRQNLLSTKDNGNSNHSSDQTEVIRDIKQGVI
jgi:glycosyltransferase involved in cell wall biosynthesis